MAPRDRLNPVDLVAYNAGNNQRIDFREVTARQFEDFWRVGCFGGFLVGREAARRLVPLGRGTVIFTVTGRWCWSPPPCSRHARTHTRRRGRLYRYCICLGASRSSHDACPVRSIAASEVEGLVLGQVRRLLASPELIARTITAAQRENGAAEDTVLEEGELIDALGALEAVWDELYPAEQARTMRVLIELDRRRGAGRPGGARSRRLRTLAGGRRVMTERMGLEVDTLTIRIPIRLQRRGGRKLIITPKGSAAPARKPRRDETLIKALVRAHRWRRRIESGRAKSITDPAEQEGVTVAYVCRLLALTCLATGIVEAILDGRQPKGLRLADILGNGPLAWKDQRETWGFSN